MNKINMKHIALKKNIYIYQLILITILRKMKKIRFIFVVMAIASLTAYVFFGCKDKDKVAPLIFINGSNPYTTELEKPYVDSLAVAEDNLDGTITGSLVVEDNIPMKKLGNDSVTSKAGTYEVTYTATDKAGNQKQLIRTVYVKNWAWKYEGPYTTYRKKISPPSDSIGYEYWKSYPYRTVQQKFNITADKDTNMKILVPLGGEIKIKVNAYFIAALTNPLRIKIEPQSVMGQIGWNGTTVDTARVLYKVWGNESVVGSGDYSASYVANQAPGHLQLIIKYYISKHSTLLPTSPSGTPVLYVDTLNQRY